MTARITQSRLESYLWGAATLLRGYPAGTARAPDGGHPGRDRSAHAGPAGRDHPRPLEPAPKADLAVSDHSFPYPPRCPTSAPCLSWPLRNFCACQPPICRPLLPHAR